MMAEGFASVSASVSALPDDGRLGCAADGGASPKAANTKGRPAKGDRPTGFGISGLLGRVPDQNSDHAEHAKDGESAVSG
jgi:hypothetical protein